MTIDLCELTISVSISVLFISLFIVLFFFTYVVYIENIIIKAQMSHLANNIFSILKLFGPNVTDKLKNNLCYLSNINLSEDDAIVEKNNNNIIIDAIIANILLIIIILIIVRYIYNKSNKSINFGNILTKNIIILIFIGLTEFCFIYFFGSKFISLNPNLVYYNIINNLKDQYNKIKLNLEVSISEIF